MSWLFLFYFSLLLEPPILMPFGVVAEARGEGRAGGGGGVVCGTIACVLRTSEPAAVAFGEALSGGGNAAYATGRSRRAQGPLPLPLFAFRLLRPHTHQTPLLFGLRSEWDWASRIFLPREFLPRTPFNY